MKTYLSVSLAAAIVALSGAVSIERAEAGPRSDAMQSAASADVSAAHRAHRSDRHRHHRPRVYVRGPYRPYYERPTYYVPQGSVPFYPFAFGYGLAPSW